MTLIFNQVKIRRAPAGGVVPSEHVRRRRRPYQMSARLELCNPGPEKRAAVDVAAAPRSSVVVWDQSASTTT